MSWAAVVGRTITQSKCLARFTEKKCTELFLWEELGLFSFKQHLSELVTHFLLRHKDLADQTQVYLWVSHPHSLVPKSGTGIWQLWSNTESIMLCTNTQQGQEHWHKYAPVLAGVTLGCHWQMPGVTLQTQGPAQEDALGRRQPDGFNAVLSSSLGKNVKFIPIF